MGDPIDLRRAEVGRRVALKSKADKFVQLARGALDDWNKSKPWLNETERADFGKQVPKLTRSGPQAAWKPCWVCGFIVVCDGSVCMSCWARHRSAAQLKAASTRYLCDGRGNPAVPHSSLCEL